MPPGIFGVARSSISAARSSSLATPSAMHMRFIEPNRLSATGTSKPVGRSNSSAGPPPGDFDTRSVTAAISRSGLTGSPMSASSCWSASARMKSLRSLNIDMVRTAVKQDVQEINGSCSGQLGTILDSWSPGRNGRPTIHMRRTNARAPESHTLHLGRDLCRQRQGAAAGSTVHDRRAALAHRPRRSPRARGGAARPA